MKKKLVYSVSVLILVLIAVQFIPFNLVENETSDAVDILTTTQASDDMADLIKNACYDCHSNATTFPWYFKIAPVSWMVNNHISEGREHFNFSNWSTYSTEDQIGILQSCAEEIEENEMPLFSYRIIHPLARLDDKEKELIINWIKSLIAQNENLPEKTDEN